jgi:predicted acylesterase/phospholipase RssA
VDGKQALVLSGGSIEGAFQAGALSVILKSGDFWPRAIHGVSVGSLNGAYLADQAGQALGRGVSSLDWAAIGESLVGFWRENITSFKVIGETVDYGYWRAVLPFGALLIGNDILNHFRGIINSERLFRIIEDKIHGVNLKKSKEAVDFYAGYVDVAEGRFYEADGQNDHILDFIKASTIEPIMKPVNPLSPTERKN